MRASCVAVILAARFDGFLSRDQFSRDQLPQDQLSRDQLVTRSTQIFLCFVLWDKSIMGQTPKCFDHVEVFMILLN